MRSWTRPFRPPGQALLAKGSARARPLRPGAALLVAVLALAGCGNYSTEDLRFLAALPQKEDLRFAVPPPGQPGALSACPPANASVWLEAKPTSDKINAGVDFLLALVDAVRRLPPSYREEDARGWGPFDAERHPGREVRVLMGRSFPAELGGGARYAYAFEARWKGTDTWRAILWGAFDGGSASRGKGWLVLEFDALHALGMNDPDTPPGQMGVGYDRTGDPTLLQLVLGADGFGAVQFAYQHAGWSDGSGVFDFAFRDASLNVLYVRTRYDAEGAGRADVGFQGSGGATGSFTQCWGADACLVYVNDPGNFSCTPVPPETSCNYGLETACPSPLPVSPFP
ncbi:MAG TPA: hypothetical protein VFL83_23455 [Anaeromyxobacter sp.]|nr:hypothetical protein [Anaeromyxobacter sp.]